MMNFVFKTKNCVSKTRNCVSKTRNFAFFNDEICRAGHLWCVVSHFVSGFGSVVSFPGIKFLRLWADFWCGVVLIRGASGDDEHSQLWAFIAGDGPGHGLSAANGPADHNRSGSAAVRLAVVNSGLWVRGDGCGAVS